MLPPHTQNGPESRSVSPVVGVILMVAVTVILAAVIGTFVLDLSKSQQAIDTESSISIDQSSAGFYVTPLTVGNDLSVRLNGETVHELSNGAVGERVFVPTSPGDRVTVVSHTSDGDVVLTSREASSRSSPDLIAYYTFEEQSGSTLIDRSENGNDGDINGATWESTSEGTSLYFDGSDYAHVPTLNVADTDDVEEFTIAVRYQITGDTSEVQQLVEHRDDSENFEWFLETDSSDPTIMRYTVRPEGVSENGLGTNEVHTVIGTFDGETMRYYADGELVATQANERTVSMGELAIGADCCGLGSQYLNGHLYEMRLYYAALSEDEVEAVTAAMEK